MNLIDIIALITTFQLFLLSFVFWNLPKGKPRSNRILASFLFSNGLLLTQFVISRLGLVSHTDLKILQSIGKSSYFLLMPLLYFYTRSLCYRTFTIKVSTFFHIIPFIISVLYLGFFPAQYTWLDLIIRHILRHMQVVTYFLFTLKLIFRYRQKLKEFYSSIERIDLSWLLFLLWTFMAMWTMDFTNFLLYHFLFGHSGIKQMILFSSIFINMIFAAGISYWGYIRPLVFTGIEEKIKYAGSNVSRSDFERYKSRLAQYMKKEKPYLDPDLSLNGLAQQLSILPKYLSQVINEAYQSNFFDYINKYRIEEFKRSVSNKVFPSKTILEILYDVGFNSKSTFNHAFKKHTGITPSEFRKNR
jgi:AraC-like DNA-binding protein